LERRLGAIFLDRDGTLNRKAAEGEYIRAPEELELLPGAAGAVRRINTAGIPAILVTNQRWLAGQAANLAAYADVESRLARLLAADGAKLDGSYTCPHELNSCDCRKPEPGLLFRAMRDFPVSLSASCVVGDSLSDARAGHAAGALAVLIAGARDEHIEGAADFVAFDIGQAVDWAIGAVLREGQRPDYGEPSPESCADTSTWSWRRASVHRE